MTNETAPTEVIKFLRKNKFAEGLIDWIKARYYKIGQDDQDDWYITFMMQEGPKRRKIEAPCKELKAIQRRILHGFLYRFATSHEAHGFVKGRSPITNAKAHLDAHSAAARGENYCAMMVDVKDFFHSIKSSSVYKTFCLILSRRVRNMDKKLQSQVADLFTNLCVKDGRLPMGAPTSPALSNLIMIPFDRKMRGICRRTNLCYTRYADDIVVSGERANSIFPFLAENLEHMEMQLNAKKTRVLRPHRAMNVTGVTINSGIPTVSKKFRRRLRAAIHNTQLFVEGAFSPLAKEPEPEKIQRLLGWAGWCASVNPKHASLLEKAKEVRRVWDTSG